MNLQSFQNLILAAGIFLLSASSCANQNKRSSEVEQAPGDRPNIIFIMADDLATQAISAYGGIYKDIAPTPNIDRLAKEGMLFQDVLCTNAICGPSRATILTGKYSHENGYYKNESGGKFDAGQWTFPQAFQGNGYQTALFGKWHLGSEPKGFDSYKYHDVASQQGYYRNPVYNENGKRVREKGYATNLTTDFALNWLKNERDKHEPFLMLLQYKAPHRAWEPDSAYIDLWNEIEMPYPDTFNDDYRGRKKTAGDTEMTMDYFNRRDMKLKPPAGLTGQEKTQWELYGVKPGELVQPDTMTREEGRRWRYQTFIKDYLACVKSVDDNVGRVLNYLDISGLTENTVVVLTSDQGFYLGDHGFFDKRFIYEESLRMPFIVRYPKMVKAGSENEDIISNVDFAPTFLDLAGIDYKEVVQGRSFMPVLQGNTPEDWRQSMYYHYYEYPLWHHVQPHYGIRTQRYTLAHFYYNIDVWELYDNQKDPDQLFNVINDPAYADVVRRLRQQLETLRKAYGDDTSLEAYREITDRNFGNIEDTVNQDI